MGFSAKSYSVNTPSMSGYNGNIQNYNYLDGLMEKLENNNPTPEVLDYQVEPEEYSKLELHQGSYDESIDDLKKIGATTATGIFSFFEGVGKFGEAIVDTAAIVDSAIKTPVSYLVDQTAGLFGVDTNFTESLWNNTKSFVSKEHVKSAFDNFYDNTEFGQGIKNNAYAFDTVRSVGNEVGYVSGVVGLTILTGGIGSGLGTATTGLSVSQGMGLYAGIAGVGKGTEKSWNEGASVGRGLAAGVASGAWEGAQFWTGGKIAGLAPTTSKVCNALLRVEADAGLGALEGFARPGINSITTGKDYVTSFKENGGMYTVTGNMVLAAVLSGLGEIKLRDLVQYGAVESKITGPIDSAEKSKILADFKDCFGNDSSHDDVVAMFEKMIKTTENPDELNALANLVEYKKANPNFELTTTLDQYHGSFYSPGRRINISQNSITGERRGVAMHETGHFLHDYKLDEALPDNWEDIAAKSRVFSSNKGINARRDFFAFMNSEFKKSERLAATEFEKSVGIGTTYKNFGEYFDHMFTENKARLVNSSNRTLTLAEIGIDDEILKNAPLDDKLIRRITELQIASEKSRIAENLFQDKYSDFAAISDIIDALYEGTGRDLKREGLEVLHKHGRKYYEESRAGGSFREMIANYTQLKTTGSERSINILRQICGDEFVNTLESTYNKMK